MLNSITVLDREVVSNNAFDGNESEVCQTFRCLHGENDVLDFIETLEVFRTLSLLFHFRKMVEVLAPKGMKCPPSFSLVHR